MPDPVSLQPLHDAWTTAANTLLAIEARVAQELADARAQVEAARLALVAALPEGVPFATVPDHPPVLIRRGDTLTTVTPHFLGDPYTPPEA